MSSSIWLCMPPSRFVEPLSPLLRQLWVFNLCLLKRLGPQHAARAFAARFPLPLCT